MSSLGIPDKGILQRKFIFILVGVVGIGAVAYFALTAKPKGTDVPVNAGGQVALTTTACSTGTDASGTPAEQTSGATSTTGCTPSQADSLSTQAKFDAWKTSITLDLTAMTTATQLSTKGAAVSAMARCLQGLRTIASSSATLGATLSKTQEELTSAIEQTEQDIQVAKDRAVLAKFPDYNRSYYDSWFPLDRPLRKQTVPILIGVSLFLACMTLLSILSFLRMDTRILLPYLNTGTTTPLGSQAKQPLFLLVLALLVVASGVAIWGFVR